MTDRSKVLILVATNGERDAVLAAARRRWGRAATATPVGNHTVFRLGEIPGGGRVVPAQVVGQGSDGPGGSTLTVSELMRLRPTDVILTGACHGLQPDAQAAGDVVVATRLIAMDHRMVVAPARSEMRGDRSPVSVRLLDRFHAATVDWDDRPVHFGPVVSLNTVLGSDAERERLRAALPEAVACDMEGAGVYAAAARWKVDWIVVKGVAGPTEEGRRAAAANAGEPHSGDGDGNPALKLRIRMWMTYPPRGTFTWLVDAPVVAGGDGWDRGRRMIGATGYARSYTATTVSAPTCADSIPAVVFDLRAEYRRFTTTVGIAPSAKEHAQASFWAEVDGRRVAAVDVVHGEAKAIDVSVTGGRRLLLGVHSPNTCGGYFVFGDGRLVR